MASHYFLRVTTQKPWTAHTHTPFVRILVPSNQVCLSCFLFELLPFYSGKGFKSISSVFSVRVMWFEVIVCVLEYAEFMPASLYIMKNNLCSIRAHSSLSKSALFVPLHIFVLLFADWPFVCCGMWEVKHAWVEKFYLLFWLPSPCSP